MGRFFLGACLIVSMMMCVSCAELNQIISQSLRRQSTANNSPTIITNQEAVPTENMAEQAATVQPIAEQQITSETIINIKQGKSANIRKEPTTSGKNIIATINNRTKLTKLDEQGDWTKVSFTINKGATKEGWVSTKLLDIKVEQTAKNVAPPPEPSQQTSTEQSQPKSIAEVGQSAAPEKPSFMDSLNKIVGSLGGNDVDVLLNYVNNAENTFRKSINVLFVVMANEDDRTKINMELEAANGIQDPKEKEAKIKEIETEKEAAVKKAVNQSDCKDKCKVLNNKNKKLYANAVYNVLLSAKFNMYAVQHSTSIVQKCTDNPISCIGITFKIGKLTSIIATLPKQIENVVDFGSTLSKIGSSANIEVQKPKSEKEEPKEVDIG